MAEGGEIGCKTDHGVSPVHNVGEEVVVAQPANVKYKLYFVLSRLVVLFTCSPCPLARSSQSACRPVCTVPAQENAIEIYKMIASIPSDSKTHVFLNRVSPEFPAEYL